MSPEIFHYAATGCATLCAILLVSACFDIWSRYAPAEPTDDKTVLSEIPRRRSAHARENLLYRLSLPAFSILGALFQGTTFEKMRTEIQLKMERANHPGAYYPHEFLGISLVAAAIAFLFGSFLFMLMFGPLGLVFGISFALAGFFYPQSWLKQAGERRTRQMERYLPHALDLIALTLDGGGTFTEALEILVRDLKDNALSDEFARLLGEIRIGRPRREALEAMAARSESEDLSMVLRAAVQGEEMGTPLQDVFVSQGVVVRQRRSNEAERYAGQAAVWILFPSTLVMFAIILLVLGPFVIKYFVEGM